MQDFAYPQLAGFPKSLRRGSAWGQAVSHKGRLGDLARHDLQIPQLELWGPERKQPRSISVIFSTAIHFPLKAIAHFPPGNPPEVCHLVPAESYGVSAQVSSGGPGFQKPAMIFRRLGPSGFPRPSEVPVFLLWSHLNELALFFVAIHRSKPRWPLFLFQETVGKELTFPFQVFWVSPEQW